MTGLAPLLGHEEVRTGLARAVARGELPGSILLHGPTGVGKQRVGLWLARVLTCESPGPTAPCDACRSCRLALRLEHPDIYWFFPVARPKSSGGIEKLADALEEVRAAELAERRERPYVPAAGDGPVGLYLAHVHTIRRLAASRPAMGRRKIFLIGDAERLVPQESSPEAANALLKLLEEPPADTTFILTTAESDALLPTMRSRLLPIRLRPIAEPDVAAYLTETFGVDPRQARLLARLSGGAIGRALGFLTDDDGPAPLEELRQKGRRLLQAACDRSPVARLTAAHEQTPAGARGEFSDVLEFLAVWIRDLAASAAGADALVVNDDAHPFLNELAGRTPHAAKGASRAIGIIDEARLLANGNVNPQLTLAWLLDAIHRALHDRPGRPEAV